MSSEQGKETCFSELAFQDMSLISTLFIHHVILFSFAKTPIFLYSALFKFSKWDLTYHQETELQAQ